MHLKELEIFGFKSFPEKTTLKFESGITVVVGPNGCGKSNVLDAIKWALGEQSPKSLRGSKMEDVIFNGTEHFTPLNYAEVIMTFVNEDRYLPIDYKEVAISRKLFRSGESEYAINKNPVRLKDVEDLFMGTGIGESTYSFVEQGKIEIFLSYKPEDKRLVFDEASGIVKYKERKKETLRRLEETQENLLRLEDIISEVARQIRYLERQVEKAKKFKEAQEQLIEVEKKIATLQSKDLQDKINALLEELNLFKTQEDDKNKELAAAKHTWEELNSNIERVRVKLEEVSQSTISLNAEIQNLQNKISFYQQRQAELKERDAQLKQNEGELNERLFLQSQRVGEETKRLGLIDAETEQLDAGLKNLKNENEALDKETKLALKQIEVEKAKILELESKKTEFHNSLIEVQTNLASLLNRKKRLSLDKGRLEHFLGESKEKLSAKCEEVQAIEQDLSAHKANKDNLILKEKTLFAQQENTKNSIVEKEKELIELRSYYDFLKDLHIKYETFSVNKKITIIFDEEPKNINKLVASLRGVSFQRDGSSYKAQVSAKVVTLEEGELEEKIKDVLTSIEQMKSTLLELEKQKEGVSTEAQRIGSHIHQEEAKRQEKSTEREHLERELLRLNEEFELVNKELESALTDITNGESTQKMLEENRLICEQSLFTTSDALKNTQGIVSGNSQRLREIDIEIAKKEAQILSLYKEKQTLDSKISLLEEEKNNILKNTEALALELKENASRTQSLCQEIETADIKIKEAHEKIEEKIAGRADLEKEEHQYACEVEDKKTLVGNLEKESETIKNSVYNKKLNIQSLEYEKEKIKDYVRQVYHIEFEPASLTEIPENLSECVLKKETLQKKIESLGEVNLIAIEEFEELKKRDDFLNQQKTDLTTSMENLKKAIQKINKTSREMFLETFAKIEEEFKKNFRFLFGGGRAQLILIDPENVLESGVEIEVQPPGKKLQNVSLLSGGEKALTAIALIFAIFKVRPSPLCVLDEIDAPLDEANVDRFNHLLRQFVQFSQFLIITHNKKTMSNANILYGVTMQEKGVSKLVSVKFSEQTKPKEPDHSSPSQVIEQSQQQEEAQTHEST